MMNWFVRHSNTLQAIAPLISTLALLLSLIIFAVDRSDRQFELGQLATQEARLAVQETRVATSLVPKLAFDTFIATTASLIGHQDSARLSVAALNPVLIKTDYLDDVNDDENKHFIFFLIENVGQGRIDNFEIVDVIYDPPDIRPTGIKSGRLPNLISVDETRALLIATSKQTDAGPDRANPLRDTEIAQICVWLQYTNELNSGSGGPEEHCITRSTPKLISVQNDEQGTSTDQLILDPVVAVDPDTELLPSLRFDRAIPNPVMLYPILPTLAASAPSEVIIDNDLSIFQKVIEYDASQFETQE